MYVCVCNTVTERDIVSVVRENELNQLLLP